MEARDKEVETEREVRLRDNSELSNLLATSRSMSDADLDNYGYLYASDGTLMGKYGASEEVRTIKASSLKFALRVKNGDFGSDVTGKSFLHGHWSYKAQYALGEPILHADFVNIRTAMAIALGGSAATARDQARYFFWVYYNRYKDEGFKGFSASTTYKKKKPNYYMFEYMLCKDEYSGPATLKGKKVKNYYNYAIVNNDSNKVGVEVWSEILERMRSLDENNPYKGFRNKGNIKDLNGDNGAGKMWDLARMYMFLTDEGKVDGSLIQRVENGSETQFLFNLKGIEAFFDENPQYDYSQAPKLDQYTGDFLTPIKKD